MNKTLYVDMDGTLAMFYAPEGNYLERMYEPDYFKFLFPYVKHIMGIKELIKKGIKVKIISACVTEMCKAEKDFWLDTFLPEIKPEDRLFCEIGVNKAKVIPEPIESTVLIDDYSKNCLEWQAAGGMAIKFLNEINGKGEKWKGETIFWDDSPETMVNKILSIVRE